MKKCPALCTNVCHMEINSSGLGRIHLKIDIILKIKEDSDVGLRPEAISLPYLLTTHRLRKATPQADFPRLLFSSGAGC